MADLGDSSWSEVDSSNNQSPPNGWPAGMFPNQVEPAARADKGALKRFWDRINSVFTSAGTSTAYTLTYPQAASAHYSGEEFSWTVNATCGDSPTLSINGIAAYPLRKFVAGAWAALVANDILANQVVRVRYNSSTPSFDIVGQSQSQSVADLIAAATPTGVRQSFMGTTSQVPAGWVLLRGNSIGDASSGGTERANADTQALFTLLWANPNYVLQTSTGSAATKGATAAADYALHSRLVLPDYTSKFAQFDNSGTNPGATGGSSSLQSGATSGSLSVGGSTSNLSGASLTIPHGNGVGGGSDTSLAGAGTYSLNGGNLSISGSTSGSLGVTGTVTPPYVTELAMVKL